MAAQCSYCGSDLRPNSMFCLDCGQVVARQGPAPSRSGSRSDRSESTEQPAARSSEPPRPQQETTSPGVPTLPPGMVVEAAPLVESPAEPVSTDQNATYVWVLAIDGVEHALRRDAFVGRRPTADAGADAIPVDDAGRTVSRTHAVIRSGGGVLSLEDLGSSNGTRVERAGQTAECRPGEPLAIGHGDVLRFGEVRAILTARLER